MTINFGIIKQQKVVLADAEKPTENHPAKLPPRNSKVEKRGLWVWTEAKKILLRKTDQEKFFNFLTTNHINEVYFYMGEFIADPRYTAKIKTFMRKAHQKGVKIIALDGDPRWAASGISAGKSFADNVIKYNLQSKSSEIIDGIKLDVEPHRSRKWSNKDNVALWKNYLKLVKYAWQQKQKNFPKKMKLYVDIPPWYADKIAKVMYKGKPIAEHLPPIIDGFGSMGYRDSREAILEFNQPLTKLSQRTGKPVVYGLEMSPLEAVGYISKVTFADNAQPIEELSNAIGFLEQRGMPAAIHYYKALRAH